jgi:hypothetical protein
MAACLETEPESPKSLPGWQIGIGADTQPLAGDAFNPSAGNAGRFRDRQRVKPFRAQHLVRVDGSNRLGDLHPRISCFGENHDIDLGHNIPLD